MWFRRRRYVTREEMKQYVRYILEATTSRDAAYCASRHDALMRDVRLAIQVELDKPERQQHHPDRLVDAVLVELRESLRRVVVRRGEEFGALKKQERGG